MIKVTDFPDIQSAANAAGLLAQTMSMLSATTTATACIELVFPPGKYSIPEPINMPDLVSPVAESGRVVLYGSGEDCFSWEIATACYAEGFEFVGFDTCLKFKTGNVSNGMFSARKCRAVDCQTLIDSTSYADSRSCVLNVDECRTYGTPVAIKSYCDILNINGGYFRQTDRNIAPFIIDSIANFNGCLMVPTDVGAGARWVDFYASDNTRRINFNGCRISGEGGGIPAVYNYVAGSFTGRNAVGISFNHSQTYCGKGGPDNAGGTVVLGVVDGEVITPNFIAFVNSISIGPIYVGQVVTGNDTPLKIAANLGFNIYFDEISYRMAMANEPSFSIVEERLKPYLSDTTTDIVL